MSSNIFGNKIPWTFKTWISRFKDVDLPIGDLAIDIIEDPDFPDDDYFPEILEYLASKHAKPVVFETVSLVWNFYLSSIAIPETRLLTFLEHDCPIPD